MYFPYLRGKQFELIAVRELVEDDLINDEIIPVIEPIKPTPTLLNTLTTFKEKNKKIAVVHNPQVGNFESEFTNLSNDPYKERFQDLTRQSNVINTHILNNNSAYQLQELESKGSNPEELLIIHNRPDFIEFYKTYFQNAPKYNLIPDNTNFRRNVDINKVLFADRFPKQLRNVDYLDIDESVFSEDHLYYSKESFNGFSDYSVVGSGYAESGFAPMAVAIHIVFFDTKNKLRIKHFVSNSNEDITDPAGKYFEALTKLIEWDKTQSLNTEAMKEFHIQYKNESYSGLGYLKKLCIKHHLELMNDYLNEAKVQ